jgi:hypothetical protein
MENILSRIDAFLESSGMTATSFGIEVVGDPRFVFDLRRDPPRKPRSFTVDWVNMWLDAADGGRRLSANDRFLFTPPRNKKSGRE